MLYQSVIIPSKRIKEHDTQTVINLAQRALTSDLNHRTYRKALTDFMDWYMANEWQARALKGNGTSIKDCTT